MRSFRIAGQGFSPAKGEEIFGMVVYAEVKDGTNYIVEVTTKEGNFKVAEITMFLGNGTVKQSNLTHKSMAFPIANIISGILAIGLVGMVLDLSLARLTRLVTFPE